MNILATKLFAKILVLPTIFGFALACCQPIFVQAVESNDTHIETSAEQEPHSHVDGLMVEEGHDCDHDDHHGQSSLQAPTQKLAVDFAFSRAVSSSTSLYQYSTIDSHFLTQPRITGPPWDGKNIKAFLGVYRS